MGLFDGFTSTARAGIADMFGVGALAEENDFLHETLLEASADARMIRRAVEDQGWTNLTGSTAAYYFDPDNQVRQDQIRRSHSFYFNDPVGRRTIDLTNFYILGKGVPMPKYRHDMQKEGAQDTPGQKAIRDFWKDEENKIGLTGFLAQYYNALEVALQGQKFFTLHPAQGTLDPDTGALLPNRRVPDGQPALRVADIPENEIVDIIPHPRKRKIPLFYKRQFQRRSYDASSGTWNNTGTTITKYYRDWRFRDTSNVQWPEGWKPPDPKDIEDGYIYHVKVNATGEMRFGMPTMNSYLKWAQGLNQYMTSRMSMVQALAQLALRVKAKGGPVNRSQVARELSNISRLAHNIENATNVPGHGGRGEEAMRLVRADQGKTKFAVESEGMDMQPMVNDTGSAGAQGDISTLQGQIAAGSGIGAHHLGGPGQATLASSTSIDGPTGKLIDWNQELWEMVNRDIVGFNVQLKSADLDPDKIEVQMPPVTGRDVQQVAATFSGLLAVLDPHGQNRALFRFIFGEILDAMGKVNTPELLDQIFGDQWKTPFEINQELQQQQTEAALAAQQSGTPAKPTGPDGRAAQAAQINMRAAANARTGPPGSRAGPDVPGGANAAVGVSRDRAIARNQRAREAGFTGGDDLLEVLAGVESEGVPDFPPEWQDVRDDAFAELDAMIGDVIGDPA